MKLAGAVSFRTGAPLPPVSDISSLLSEICGGVANWAICGLIKRFHGGPCVQGVRARQNPLAPVGGLSKILCEALVKVMLCRCAQPGGVRFKVCSMS